MKIPRFPVNTIPQPPLLPAPALAITLQACVDRDAETVIFAVMAVDPISDHLQALWSTSPQPFESFAPALHEAYSEFLNLVYPATGPFA